MSPIEELNAYCVKCKETKVTSNFGIEKIPSGRKMAYGKCPTCGTDIQRLLNGEADHE